MIKNNTVFIIGAGATKPYGYPTGLELRKYLCQDYKSISYDIKNTDSSILQEKINYFSDSFYNSLIPSIDQYLSLCKDDNVIQEIGKIGILYYILRSEKLSSYAEGMVDYETHDWLTYLYRRMVSEFKTSSDYINFKDNNVSFIIFNYDRMVEFVLSNSFYYSFNTDRVKNFDLLGDEFYKLFPFKFVHVYGKIASLQYEKPLDSNYYDFKKIDNNDFAVLTRLKDNIRTIYDDDRVVKEDIKIAKGIIKKADRIFILGFGYANENLSILDLPNLLNSNQRVYGTAYNLTESEIRDVRERLINNPDFKNLMSSGSNNPYIENTDCLSLLRKYL